MADDEDEKPFATAADLERRWRPLSDAEKALADERLMDVTDLIKSQYPGWTDRTPRTLERICCQVVRRSMEADARSDSVPAGATNYSETAGPFSQSFQFAEPTSDLRLWPSEEKELGGRPAKAWTYDMCSGEVNR